MIFFVENDQLLGFCDRLEKTNISEQKIEIMDNDVNDVCDINFKKLKFKKII